MAMFNNTKEVQKVAELSGSNTHIAKGAMFAGDLETYGTLRLEGKVFGNIKSKGKVSLGETSYVQGNVLAQNAEIAGEVSGTVEIVEILTLKSTALINGDIFCSKLIVESGATFNGKCQMGAIVKEIIINEDPQNNANTSISQSKKTNVPVKKETETVGVKNPKQSEANVSEKTTNESDGQ